MAPRTVRLRAHPAPARKPDLSASRVLLMRHGLHVFPVDTVANTAEVIEFEALWNGADKEFVGETVGLHLARAIPEAPIAVLVLPCTPQPTRPEVGAVCGDGAILIDLGPESIFYHAVM